MAQVTFTMKNIPPAATGTAGNMYYNSTNNELYIANANGTYGNAIGGDWIILANPIALYDATSGKYPWIERCSSNTLPKELYIKIGKPYGNSWNGVPISTLIPGIDRSGAIQLQGMMSRVPAFSGASPTYSSGDVFVLTAPIFYTGNSTPKFDGAAVLDIKMSSYNAKNLLTFTTSLIDDGSLTTTVTRSFGNTAEIKNLASYIYIVAYRNG